MEKIVNRLINESLVNVDRYNNNNSTWLIFTETKQWVIELTKDGTLWYNYNFFKNLFVYMSMDVVENQHYITKWVEDTIINEVKHLRHRKGADDSRAENIIQNGVKEIELHKGVRPSSVEDTIQNGVKRTSSGPYLSSEDVEYTIQNGVKHTEDSKSLNSQERVEDTIENGVKLTNSSLQIDGSCVIEDVIENGVKHTEYGDWLDGDERLDDIIQNGVKETIHENHHRLREIVVTMKEGIKEVQPLPAQDGNIDWGNYYYRKGNPTKPFTEYVNDVIKNGEKF